MSDFNDFFKKFDCQQEEQNRQKEEQKCQKVEGLEKKFMSLLEEGTTPSFEKAAQIVYEIREIDPNNSYYQSIQCEILKRCGHDRPRIGSNSTFFRVFLAGYFGGALCASLVLLLFVPLFHGGELPSWVPIIVTILSVLFGIPIGKLTYKNISVQNSLSRENLHRKNSGSSSNSGQYSSQSSSNKSNSQPKTQREQYEEILGLHGNWTKETLIAAYRKLSMQYHPDRTQHLGKEFIELAERKMKEINAAYDFLTNNP